MKRIVNFNTGSASFNKDGTLSKQALLFYECEPNKPHIDSSGRPHFIDGNYLYEIAENTNKYLEDSTVYLIDNHNKNSFNSALGVLNSELTVREITDEDVEKNPKLKKLVGRLGLWAEDIRVTDPILSNKIKSGLNVVSVSIGLDPKEKKVKEISSTIIPALSAASMFNQYTGNNMNEFGSLSLKEKLDEEDLDSQIRQEAHDLFAKFLSVVDDILSADEDMLQGQSQEDLLMNVVSEFEELLFELLGLNDLGEDPTQQNQPMTPNSRMNNPNLQGKYSMYEIEKEIANFNFPWQPKPKKPSLLKRGLQLGAAGLAGAAAMRYGGRAIGAGRGALKGLNQAAARRGQQVGIGQAAKAFGKAAWTSTKRGVGADVGRAMKLPETISTSVGGFGTRLKNRWQGTYTGKI